MRALFTCLPGYGSFYPMVPFARALEDAGHQVAFVTAKLFGDIIEREGFEFLPGGIDYFAGRSTTYPEELSIPSELPTIPDRWLFAYTEFFRGTTAQTMIPDLLRIIREWQPDLIVRENLEFGGCVVAEILDIPHAVASAVEFYPPWVERALQPAQNALRTSYGLPSDPEGIMPHRYLTLTGLPPEWVGKHEYCPPTTHFVQPEPYSGVDNQPLPGWIAELPDRPTVHASLGTVFNLIPGVYEAIIEALRDEPINLILTVGPQRDPTDFGTLPDHIRIEQYLPHPKLLPYCDTMISHAGYGSTIAFLMQGIPALLLPITVDQPRNGARMVELGAGIALSELERTPEKIREAVKKLLEDESYRLSAETLKVRMEALPGPDCSVRLLEQLAEHRKPIFRDEAKENRG